MRWMVTGLALTAFLSCAVLGALGGPAPPPPAALPAPDLSLTPEDVVLYPLPVSGPGGRWLFYRGDRITLDVTPRHGDAISPQDLTVRVYRLAGTEREVLAEGSVGYPAFDGVPRARLVWAWDTRDAGGRETLVVHLDPDDRVRVGDEDPTNNVVTLTVRFIADTARPAPEVAAHWAITTTHCCVLHYLTCSRAERDLPTLVAATESAVAFVQERLGTRLASPMQVYFIGRVVGHGGYARESIVLSYPDRLYADADLDMVLRHEAVHLLDAPLLGPETPAMLREGLAVWVAGGHYRPGPVSQQAAALLRLGRYIPLGRLVEDFYHHQHETGYLEAAGLVAYLVETWGWDRFLDFYRRSGQPSGAPAPEALDGALRDSFGIGLEEMEWAFQEWLRARPVSAETAQEVELTIRLFDALRRYQRTYDPPAYFLSGWFPDPAEGERQGIVADFLRRPRAARAVAIEAMMVSAQDALRRGALDDAAVLLVGVERALDGDFSAPPASDYLAVVRAVAARGGEVQQVELDGETARVRVAAGGDAACAPPRVWVLHRAGAAWTAGE